MGCLPDSGGCERQRTDPFVSYLSELEGKHFSHEKCLDRIYRNSPQPEALYIDTDTTEQLVIERKTLVWPRDYPSRHKNDHFVAHLLIEGLKDLTNNAPYTIELEAGLLGRRDDLAAFGNHITTVVRGRFPEVERGGIIGEAQSGHRWRFFRGNSVWRREDGQPEKGLVVEWSLDERLDLVSAPPSELLAEVSRLFESCVQKFQAYLHARRILLIDQYGDLRYLGDFWWKQVLEVLPVPSEIPEVWMATYDWITDWEEDWIFEKLYPMSPPQEEDGG
jgi:hypothetical protein